MLERYRTGNRHPPSRETRHYRASAVRTVEVPTRSEAAVETLVRVVALIVVGALLAIVEWHILRRRERGASQRDAAFYHRTLNIGAYAVGFAAIFIAVLIGHGPKAWALAIAAVVLGLPLFVWFLQGMRSLTPGR